MLPFHQKVRPPLVYINEYTKKKNPKEINQIIISSFNTHICVCVCVCVSVCVRACVWGVCVCMRAPSIMVIIAENGISDLSSNLDEAVCVSLCPIDLVKDMNLSVIPIISYG